MQWYLKALKQYADFSGRARRTEFWMFVLISFIISLVLAIIDSAIGTAHLYSSGGAAYYSPGILGGIYSLAVLIPTIAVTVRRLHDTDRSGWWFFIQLIPIVGSIVLLVFMCLEGTRGPNRFGLDPKAATTTSEQPGHPAMPA
ncbi:DUF805 domain-containing protein [Actinomycetospora endophytica]|uniref:DUF805 domain-containing protein n=1 Tax=Actinomycetospora endophytica TaxID=2291215 RepID=A0ABS8PAT4_9PSEU|nr:DUF805 domain-containing protein [Actinomycetospora endophytica]MCD2195133.1 DUF805 domain-containing protein [Actinomycetospora endophytica]